MSEHERAFIRNCIEYQSRLDCLLAWMECDPLIHPEWVTVWQRPR